MRFSQCVRRANILFVVTNYFVYATLSVTLRYINFIYYNKIYYNKAAKKLKNKTKQNKSNNPKYQSANFNYSIKMNGVLCIHCIRIFLESHYSIYTCFHLDFIFVCIRAYHKFA